MRRRGSLELGTAAGAVTVAGCVRESSELAFEEGFEDGLGERKSVAAVGPETEAEPR